MPGRRERPGAPLRPARAFTVESRSWGTHLIIVRGKTSVSLDAERGLTVPGTEIDEAAGQNQFADGKS